MVRDGGSGVVLDDLVEIGWGKRPLRGKVVRNEAVVKSVWV